MTQEAQQNDKRLRSEYRSLIDKAERNKHNLVSTDGNQLQEIIREADLLSSRVSKPRELALDSELFQKVTGAGEEYVKKLARGGKNYTAGDFIRRLKAHYVYDTDAQERGAADPSAFDWAAVGRTVARFFRPVPVVFHMLGPMDALPKEKRQVVRQKRKAQVGDAVRPEELTEIGDSEKQETDKNMEEMWTVLKAQEGHRADLLQLVLNHHSFAQTVENLFTLSFLVRDKRVDLHTQDSGVEVVAREKAPRGQKQQQQQQQEPEKERVQFVVELDIDRWETFKSVVEPGTTLMRHRPEHHHDGVNEGGDDEQQQAQQQQQQQQQQTDDEEEEAGPSQRQPRHQKRQQQQQQQVLQEEEDLLVIPDSEEEEVEEDLRPAKRSTRR